MATKCRACKREIAKAQKQCYVCGASQSFIQRYLKRFTPVVFLFFSFGVAGYWYLTQALLTANIQHERMFEEKLEKTNKELDALKSELEYADEQLLLANKASLNTGELAKQVELKSNEMDKKYSQLEKRAGWLSRENGKLKAEIKFLKEKEEESARKVNSIIAETEEASNFVREKLMLELAALESQQVSLTERIALTELDMKKNWNDASNGLNESPSADILEKRALELENTTRADSVQLKILSAKIEKVKLNILDVK